MKQKGFSQVRSRVAPIRSGFAPLLIILIIAILGAGIFWGYKYVSKKNAQKTITPAPYPIETPTSGSTKTPSPYPIETINPTVNWKTYTSTKYKFSFKYPNNFKVRNSIEKPFYSLEEPIVFGIVLTQDIYTNLGQTPAIKVQVVQTNKTINQILDQLKSGIEDTKESMSDPNNIYYGANPPKINSIETIQIENIEATKVERYQGPGAPNAEILEYYIKSPTHVFILTSNYGTNNPDVGQDGTLEKETLSKIITTFKFVE